MNTQSSGRVVAVAMVILVTAMLPVGMFSGTAVAAPTVWSAGDMPSSRPGDAPGTATHTAGFTKSVALGPAGTTYTVTSPSLCGGPGTFEQALKDANANPGTDTISFTPGLVVDASSCTTPGLRPFPYATFATESVDIVGNGATVEGNQLYMTRDGHINVRNICPTNANSLIIRQTFGFIQIGTFDADNTAVAVSIAGLTFHNLPTLAKVEKNASLSMTDSSASDIVDFNGSCNREAILGEDGANVTLTRTQIVDSTMPKPMLGEDGVSAVVAGNGNLMLDHVLFERNDFGRAVTWSGGSAKIVSSRFVTSGGFIFNADTTSMVNSALFVNGSVGRVPASQAPTNRIMTDRGDILIQASTLYWDDPTCAACTDKGMGIWITDPAARVSFLSSAIGTQLIRADTGPLLLGYNGTAGKSNRFDSDALTWVQPTANQDAAALQAVLPSVMTNPPGLISDVTASLVPYTTVLTPRLGTSVTPGVLLDAVANAQCGGANQLLSPIDGSCVTTDVFGNPRIDAGNSKRDIGAVQTAQSPFLAVTSITADIGLGWNRPPDPISGTITGYRVTYVPIAGGTPQSMDVTGPDTTSTTITGLTVGTPYRFTVAPVNVAGPGTPSNEVQATPLAAVDAPTVTATGGDSSAQIFWTEPTLGGHPGPPSYYVMYRPTGTTSWIAGPGPLSARTTSIPGLTNGTGYDVGVFATSTDGTASALATTTVTPVRQYVPVTPFRIFDTRNGQGGVGTAPVTPNTLTYFDYGNTTLPLNASAYVLNVTAVGPTQLGDLRIADACDPGGAPTRSTVVPETSLVNYQVGQAIANAIVVPNTCGPTSAGLRVFSDNSPVNVVVDVEGYYLGQQVQDGNTAFDPTPPTRIADTRTGVNTGGASSITPGSHITIQVTGTGVIPGNPGIPADAKAVAINLTAINPNDFGNLRVYPDGSPVPNTSNINYIPGVDKAAFAVVDIPADGKIDVYSDGATIGLAADVFGYYPSTSNVVTAEPVRVFDSRNTAFAPPPGYRGALNANVAVSIPVAGKAGVPMDAQAVLVSVTSIHSVRSTGNGNLRVFPADAGVPYISNINYISPTTDVANFAIVKLSANGQLSLYSDGSPIHAAVDVLGYVPAGS